MQYKLAIFDLDGTILNTLDDLCDSVNYALSTYSMPKRTLDEVRSFVGDGIMKLIERSVPINTPEEQIIRVFESFTAYYRNNSANKTRPYNGVNELLRSLRKKGVITTVLSNKADFAVRSLCNVYFNGLFDYVAGEKEGMPRKPSPDGVFQILNKYNVAVKDAIYIGDSDVDFSTAQNAGIDYVLVSWGFRSKDFLLSSGAVNVVDTPEELLAKVFHGVDREDFKSNI